MSSKKSSSDDRLWQSTSSSSVQTRDSRATRAAGQRAVLNFATDLKHTLEAPITLNDGGKTKRVSTQKAMFLRMREKALKGDGRALDRLLEFARVFSVGPTEATTKIVSADDQAILDAFREEILATTRTVSTDPSDENSGEEGSE